MKNLFLICFVLTMGVIATAYTTVETSTSTNEVVENTDFASCTAKYNLNETCQAFISRCCKGSIHSEFPSEFLDSKIDIVKKGNSAKHKKAWKLLNDNRFKK